MLINVLQLIPMFERIPMLFWKLFSLQLKPSLKLTAYNDCLYRVLFCYFYAYDASSLVTSMSMICSLLLFLCL